MAQQFRNFRLLDASLSLSSVYGQREIGGKKLAADAITVLACFKLLCISEDPRKRNCYRRRKDRERFQIAHWSELLFRHGRREKRDIEEITM